MWRIRRRVFSLFCGGAAAVCAAGCICGAHIAANLHAGRRSVTSVAVSPNGRADGVANAGAPKLSIHRRLVVHRQSRSAALTLRRRHQPAGEQRRAAAARQDAVGPHAAVPQRGVGVKPAALVVQHRHEAAGGLGHLRPHALCGLAEAAAHSPPLVLVVGVKYAELNNNIDNEYCSIPSPSSSLR